MPLSKTNHAELNFANGAFREMPQYQCHKKVWALKIKSIQIHTPNIEALQAILDKDPEAPVMFGIIEPMEEGYGPFPIYQDFWKKHLADLHPTDCVGGYYVVYEDGYKSFSPAEVFESGYTRI